MITLHITFHFIGGNNNEQQVCECEVSVRLLNARRSLDYLLTQLMDAFWVYWRRGKICQAPTTHVCEYLKQNAVFIDSFAFTAFRFRSLDIL